jgi:uncharacterized protein (DUF433 family)
VLADPGPPREVGFVDTLNEYRLIGAGIYTIPEASRLSGVPISSIRRWTRGYDYVSNGRRRSLPSVVKLEIHPIEGVPALSFRDLQEVRFLHAFRQHGVSWHTLRLASDRAKATIGDDHPFSTGRFRSFGNAILAEIAVRSKDAALLDVVRNQLAFRRIVAPYLKGLEFAKGEPVRWFPIDSRLVVLDPLRRFGQPITTREGVPTAVLAKAYRAERSYKKVAAWYEIPVRSIRAAVEYENRLAA